MWAKYNIDELRAGCRNFGVGTTVIGFANLMFGFDPLSSLFAITLGIWVFFKTSEKGGTS